ncbi:MAG: tRNA cyclic N6-threonylcarbamoyladenosine(37) synthase TcdA [Desulfuromonas sp.]|uniref:tRNA threonylcarbamoyladenosine dehydratase n=1 Tax=Desulfuromonas sp. TaxID=892 RepID=UPI000CBE08EA|nr:tRNA threonylcarbamoyladenosine dehydratase [Desulfuromonas sp.]PLX84973.1 MAG: tRNA cyclic N6-threonylcarbamoyladenosine(37) synthase TcdA [Desulfuromonas sp.]
MSQHRFSRMELLVGEAGLARLKEASVAVFGVGGGGSYAAEALARAGVGRLTLVDFDEVCITNVNRQIHALEGTIGRPKVQVMATRCRAINPALEVEPVQEFYGADNAERLLGRGYDFLLDCIDNITAKLHLIQNCKERGIAVISAMGAANKLDPTKVAVADLFHTEKCRLARIMRKELRRRGVASGVKVVYSTEGYRLLPGVREAVDDGEATDCRRRRVPLGSSSHIPPLFGLTMAGEVVQSLLEEA